MAKNQVLQYKGQGGYDLTTGMPMDPATMMPGGEIVPEAMPPVTPKPKAKKPPTKSKARAPKSTKLA